MKLGYCLLAFSCACSTSHPVADASLPDADAYVATADDTSVAEDVGPVFEDAEREPDGSPSVESPPFDCEPGTQRWCDDAIYSNWGRQHCLPDGTWGPCIEGRVTAEGQEDRPNNVCGCRFFYFNPECCENPDCVIPEDHVPPDCERDGSLCAFCDVASQCGDEDDWCLYGRDGYAFCSRDCETEPCPPEYECTEITTRSGVSRQCTPVAERCE